MLFSSFLVLLVLLMLSYMEFTSWNPLFSLTFLASSAVYVYSRSVLVEGDEGRLVGLDLPLYPGHEPRDPRDQALAQQIHTLRQTHVLPVLSSLVWLLWCCVVMAGLSLLTGIILWYTDTAYLHSYTVQSAGPVYSVLCTHQGHGLHIAMINIWKNKNMCKQRYVWGDIFIILTCYILYPGLWWCDALCCQVSIVYSSHQYSWPSVVLNIDTQTTPIGSQRTLLLGNLTSDI